MQNSSNLKSLETSAAFSMETWNERAFREAGIHAAFVQDNHSRSVRNALRGLHYQIKQSQGKLVHRLLRPAAGALHSLG
jgi:dTDP-4-dehydrorhamnose 3,5-epimerase-like enzyme